MNYQDQKIISMKILLLLLLLLNSISFASSKMYIGSDDYGRFVAGLEVKQKIVNDSYLRFDIESIDISSRYGKHEFDIKPKFIKYTGELIIGNIGYEHSCTHQIDGFSDVKDKDLATDKIYYKYSY